MEGKQIDQLIDDYMRINNMESVRNNPAFMFIFKTYFNAGVSACLLYYDDIHKAIAEGNITPEQGDDYITDFMESVIELEKNLTADYTNFSPAEILKNDSNQRTN